MAKTLSRKDLNRLLKGFEDQGATIKACSDGYRVLPPNGGKPLTIHLTLSDARGLKNLRADARRVDLDWPLD